MKPVRKTRDTDDERSDSELLRLADDGDEGGFLELYRRHRGPVFRFALHMSGNGETAEEVTQEVFLALLEEAKLYRAERGSLQGYLIGVARNRVRRHLAQRRETRLELDEEYGDLRASEDAATQLLEGIWRDQELRALHAAVLSLPANYREVVVLCDLEEMEYSQAAEHLGCAVGTVRSRLHRARAILSAKLHRRERCSV